MFQSSDLQQVNRYQDELRRDAEKGRLVARAKRSNAKRSKRAPERSPRFLGLRLSFA